MAGRSVSDVRLMHLNLVGWSALVGVGAVVTAVAALWMPLPAALAVGFAVAFSAYAVEWLFTWRDLQTTIDGFTRLEDAEAAAQALRQHGIAASASPNPDADVNPEDGVAMILLPARHRRRALRLVGLPESR